MDLNILKWWKPEEARLLWLWGVVCQHALRALRRKTHKKPVHVLVSQGCSLVEGVLAQVWFLEPSELLKAQGVAKANDSPTELTSQALLLRLLSLTLQHVSNLSVNQNWQRPSEKDMFYHH